MPYPYAPRDVDMIEAEKGMYFDTIGLIAETFGIVTDLELPADVFMACELAEGGLDGVQGRVEFAPEFNLDWKTTLIGLQLSKL